ncbi:DUF6166 domain-containing protein [Halalkaliarchaeum sp. AArc-CO]|uniref:DUF6166 domain-containing protein n=1 Tax=Halalkaliarchaeum sp. AArc-CO TaxID=2866381 RepID=UPI002B279D00|nr:DUF6166 domain-containing protein [Halalkaliarchaeum sp. AArc-CO]
MSRRPLGSTHGDAHRGPSSTGGQAGLSTEAVYRGRRDPTAPVGEEVEVTVDGEPLDKRYDLLSASPSGFEYGYGGSGPAQLAIAILAHAYNDDFACEWYQRFKREVIAELPEDGWTLTTSDLDAWREGVTGDA